MKTRAKINPFIGCHPLMLLLTMVVPQLILLFYRVLVLLKIHLEVAGNETWVVYSNYIGIPIVLTLAGTAVVIWAKRKRRGTLWPVLLVLFLMHVAALVFFLMNIDKGLFPRGVDRWILPAGPFVFIQLATSMPALFYSLICLANIRLFRRTATNILTSFATLALIPAGLHFAAIYSWRWSFSEGLIIGLFVLGTVVAAFAFLQLLLWLSSRIRREWVAILVFGLIFPLVGLALNYGIPFPAPLQHWGFYALTVINAAILLWSCRIASGKSFLSGLATAASYSFTCYFFFLFLPFLPFSLLAMIAAGAGFLILTPAILFIIHTRRLLIQGKALAGYYGKWRVIFAFTAVFLLVPGAYVGRALIHRQIFRQVLDQVYIPDFKADPPVLSPRISRYVLNRMIQMKNGVYVPILSECYNRFVFDGMVLPDRKIEELSTLLLGKDADTISLSRDWDFYSFFTGESQRRFGRDVRKPVQNVVLSETKCSHLSAAGVTEATVLLTMTNDDHWQAEYTADITIPSGVFASGYELKIGDKMVPGRISDRKAAQWVYHMIRDDARRDPGLLVYTGPNSLRLSVYPFEPNQQRQCLIRFLYPAGAAPNIRIGDREIPLSSEETAEVCMITRESGAHALYVSPAAARNYPAVVREKEQIYLDGSSQSPGYCPEWQVKRELLNYFDSGEHQVTTVPFFITRTQQPIVEFDGAAYWLPYIPDGGWQKSSDSAEPPSPAVLIFRCGEQIQALPAKGGGLLIFDDPGPIEWYDSAGHKFMPIVESRQIAPGSRYSLAIDLMQKWWVTQMEPATEEPLRRELLGGSRKLNILIPGTAFIAVENSAQEQALKDAEDKAMEMHTALEFDEFDSPEPGLILMVCLALPVLFWMQKRKGSCG